MPEYRPIPPIAGCSEWPHWYRAGDDGTVWSRRKRGRRFYATVGEWKQLRPKVNKRAARGKPTVRLLCDGSPGKGKLVAVDLCVCAAFHGPRPDGHVVLHSPDANPLNCRADNLKWAARGQRKTAPRPEPTRRTYPGHRKSAHNARLHEALVLEIRTAHANGETTKQICEKHGLNYSVVRNVINRRTWKDVWPADESGQEPMPKRPRAESARAKRTRDRASADTSKKTGKQPRPTK